MAQIRIAFDTFDGAKPRFLNRGKERRSVSTLSPSTMLEALSLSRGIPRASDRGVEWVDFSCKARIGADRIALAFGLDPLFPRESKSDYEQSISDLMKMRYRRI
jgi:hypothetical protein